MIKSLVHASQVQALRYKSGKRGYAKSVRRFLLKNHSNEYLELRNDLAVNWPEEVAQ